MPPRAPLDPIDFADDLGNDDWANDIQPLQIPTQNFGAGASGSRPNANAYAPQLAQPPGFNAPRNVAVAVEEMDWEEDDRQDSIVLDLIRAWTNERLAPDILDQQGELVQKVLDRIREQADLVQQLRADPDASEDEHFKIILVQTEVERMRFMVRSYMRTRIHKIEKYAHYILQEPEMQARLSTIEFNHAQSYASLIDTQLDVSVLNALPQWLRREGANWQGPSTISKPDRDTALFVKARQDCNHVLLPDGRPIDIPKDSIVLVRYSTIENNLRRGEVELV